MTSAAFERALPDLDPELGDAYVQGSMAAVHKVIEARGERTPSYYSRAFEDEFAPYAALYAGAFIQAG